MDTIPLLALSFVTALAAYRDDLSRLGAILTDIENPPDAELAAALRALIDKVIIHDRQDGSVDCEVVGCLGPLVRPELGGGRADFLVAGGRYPSSPPAEAGGGRGEFLVAGGRYASPPPVTWGRFRA